MGFPYAKFDTGKVVKGEMYYVDREVEKKVLRDLDWLEGYNETHPEDSFYVRKEILVKDETGVEHLAYGYEINTTYDFMDEENRIEEW